DPSRTPGPHLQHWRAEESPMGAATGAGDARKAHDLHTPSSRTRRVRAQGLQTGLRRKNTSEKDPSGTPDGVGGSRLVSSPTSLLGGVCAVASLRAGPGVTDA